MIATQRASFLPSALKLLFLAVSIGFFFILSTGGAAAQTADDHGNTLGAATDISLGFSIDGRIDHGLDRDVFKLDLFGASGYTDVWIYTTGDFDSWGQLYDSTGTFITLNDDLIGGTELNFHLRAVLPRGVYYVIVFSADDTTAGDYTLHAQVATDPGSTPGTATRLVLDSPTTGTIDTPVSSDFFTLDFTESTNVLLIARSGNLGPVDITIFDARGVEVSANVYRLLTRRSTFLSWSGFAIRDDFDPGTYYLKVNTPESFVYNPLPYTILAVDDTAYTDFTEECESSTRSFNNPQIIDPLYGCQWHLNNLDGQDINVEDVWAEGIKGEGVNVAVVDSGLDYTHEDLVGNVDTSLNHDYTGDGDVYYRFAHHGTHVAGVVAAGDDDIGVRGVAPRATIYGYNLLRDVTDVNIADAMTRNGVVTAVSNNSWGPSDGPGWDTVPSIWEAAVDTGIRTGFNGKGTFYAWAAGNGHLEGDDSNLDEFANYYGVTAVCAVSDHDTRSSYSEMGANLWVCGPANDLSDEHRGIVTTENSDRYFEEFGGTSAATPAVAGVAALMRGANPDLTWRDLKLILAASARKINADIPGWEDGARKYGSGSDGDRYHFNHEYGFGVVDAKAAVDLAKGWNSLPPMGSSPVESGLLNKRIPDAPETGDPVTITSTLTLDTGLKFTEFVEINVSLQHGSFRDLEIELVSPSGAVSRLVGEFDTYADSGDLVPLYGTFRFGSARHLGEDPNGVWQLQVTDRLRLVGGTLESWSLTVYGHGTNVPCATQGAVPNAVNNPGLVSDCESLLEARDTLAGSATLNWSADTPIADWDGVTVGGAPQRVTEINHYGGQLTGAIPAELGSLTNLKVLFLSQNQLTGTIPPELAGLSNLEALDLYGNQLTGPIPPDLGNLSELVGLNLSSNQLSGEIPASLGNLDNLRRLSLAQNRLSGEIPAGLGSLADLQQLFLSPNQLDGCVPQALRDVTSHDLDDLGLPYCDVLLSGLTISPGSLTTLFDPYRTEYDGVVSTSRVTVTPVNVYNSTFRFLDDNDGEIADADGSLNGHQIDLATGITTVRIRVISQDGQATVTYTVQVSRIDPPGAPVVSDVTPGEGSLTVAWTAPGETGGSDITSYDLRYIESDAPDKADANWSVLDDAWTSGPLSYTITGLADEAKYDVQVRAVNAVHDGSWSDEATATTPVSKLPVFADGVTATRSVAENAAEGTDVGTPIAASDADNNTLTYTLGGADAALFTIDETTGQIKVGAGTTLDYESGENTYIVEVTAANPPDAGATITVTINVIDVDLGPLGSRYDANNDRVIERDEVLAAIVDYFDDLITREQVLQVIALYFGS